MPSTPYLSRAGPRGARYANTASAIKTGNASDMRRGCQLKMPDVVAVSPVLTGVNAKPPRSLKTHTDTSTKVVSSHALVSQVNQSGGGGPRNVFATPPSSYSSMAIGRYCALKLLARSDGVITARPAACLGHWVLLQRSKFAEFLIMQS